MMIYLTRWSMLYTSLYILVYLIYQSKLIWTLSNSSIYSYTYTTYIPSVIFNSHELVVNKIHHHHHHHHHHPKQIQLNCPLIHAQHGDLLMIFQSTLSIHQVILNETNLKVHYILNIDHRDHNDYTTDYWCKLHRTMNNDYVIISEIQLILTSNLTYETFVYERKETQIVEGVLGEKLTVTCNPTTSQNNWNNKSVVWYRLPGLKINGQTSPNLYIDRLTIDDLGTYFCSEHSTSLHRNLPVQKIEIWSHNFMSEINFGKLITSENLTYFQCPNVFNEYTFVIWEYPMGNVIVNEYDYKFQHPLQLHHTKHPLPICQYGWIDQMNTTIDQHTYLKRSRRSIESIPYITISKRIDPDDPTVILQCHMPPNEAESVSFNYQWSTVESGKIGDSETIVRQLIIDHIPDDGVKRDTSITCEVTSSETGEIVGSIKLDLEPKSLSTTGKMELSETTTEIFSYRNGESLELHCELEKDFVGTGENVVWTFNGGTLPTGTNRLDRLRTSVIVIKEMENIHEGLYECQQNSKKLRGHIIRAPTIVTLSILPKEDEAWANAGDITEFHCRLDGREHGNQLIDWYFIPEGDDREISLHNDVKIDNPDATPSTSFLSIMNVQKYHEGLYVCRALNLRDTAKLIVKTRDLSVTPEEVKARPGTTVQFLCELSTITGMKGGKVFWMRTDRQDLRPGKEEVIGTNGGRALLIVKDVGRFDHNISYMCTDGYSKGYAKLYVQEVCAPGFRPCGSQECLEETKFCDGVVDCEDGYDEIPSKCSECGVNENVCGIVNDVKPLKNCYLQFWHCDGEDDCGNNYDESNCLAPSVYDQCNGTHYTCPQGDKMIARAFMCDSVPDCEPNGDDESECSYPSIIEPSGETHLIGHQSENLTLTCVAYGRPPPTISWRYNWGHLREGVKHSINYTVINCNMAISHLTLYDLESRASGLYTCEAVNRGRALAPDFLVNVAKGGICKAPQFNDAAWFDDMCLTCYCSNVTDKCTSVKGYRKSPHDLMFDYKTTPIILSTYNQDGSVEEGQGVTEIDGDILRIPDVPNEATFVESDFNLSGSWVKSYGYDIILNLRLFGESLNYLPGPFIILNSTDRSIYWCPPNDRLLVHAIPTGYDNRIHIRLTERDKWYIDNKCKHTIEQTIGRSGFMQVLSNVKKISLRVKYFQDQTTLELFNIKVEHAIKSDVPGQWVGEIEECICPHGYEGLSCEKCAPGYQKDPDNPLKCRPYCACDKCDTDGNCIECPGKRAGPRCQQCKDGYYRPDKSLLITDCQPCDMCGNNLPYVVKTCQFNPQADDDYFCKCRISEDNKLINPNCDRCQLAIDSGEELPVDAKCDTKAQPIDCHYHGTQLTSDNGDCQCKTGYTGVKCDECEEGYFNYMGQCLQCYCSGKTSSCRLSDEHYFWNITTEDSAGFGFNVWLGQRTDIGGLQRNEYTPDGNPRIERELDNFYVKYPLNNKGIIHFGINLIPPKPSSLTQNDVAIYKYIYGGKMSFRIDSIKLNPNELTQREASVVVELESPRYGRIWTLATYNLTTQRYEIEFHENWWPGGWRFGTPLTLYDTPMSLTRNQLLRFLITTTNIGIITSSGNSESLNDIKLSGISIQVSIPIKTNERQLFANEQGLAKAPVEICDCPNQSTSSNERELSPSCEGCTDLSKQTVIRLEPLGEDVQCGGCLGDKCKECSEGEYIYDIYSGKRFDSCQKAVTIDTKSRRVIVKLREPINLICKATSYRGGLVTHEWITPNNEYASQPIISRQYLTKPNYYNTKENLTTYQSEALLQIKFAKPEDAGEYKCIAKGIGTEVKETFYVVVIDPNVASPPDVPEDDEINRKFPLPTPPILDPPVLTVYEIKKDPDNPQITLISGQVKPEILDTHHTIWYSINGTLIPGKTEITDTARGAFTVQLSIPYETIKLGNDSIIGYFIGKDPVYTPQWTRMMEPVIIDTEADEITPDDIINPPTEITIPFMQPYIVQVRTKPGKEDISVNWKKIGPLPETIKEKKDDDVKILDSDSTLPEGTSQDKTNLNIWAAAEQHEGIYEGIVLRDRDGVEVKRIQTIIRVQPMTSGSKTELGLAEAAEPIESEVDDDDDEKEEEPPTWDFIVGGFTPDAKHCETPTWTIVDYQLNKTTDITNKVIRTSNENFRVNYPLTSGLYLRFQCKPIPMSNLTGEIKFNISSPDPRIILKPIYDNPDSTFPTRLVCMDLNPEYDSSVNLSSSSMSQEMISHAITSSEQKLIIRKGDIPPIRRLEMDWRRIGEFDPFNDDGYFTCFVNNTETNGSKTIKLPSDKVPIQLPEDPFTRLYIYSPDTYVVPELDGSAKIMIPEGEQLRIYCVFEARPSSEFHGWRGTTTDIENNLKIEHRIYSSLAQTDHVNLNLDGQKIECVYGERTKPVEISVIHKDERKLHAKILSDAFINDRLVGITGSDMNLTCDVKHTTRKPVTIDRIDWFVQYPNGIRRDIKHTQLADSLSTGPQGEWIYFTKLTDKPQGLNIFCVVRLEDIQKATQAYYSSPHISLWLREPKVLVSIEGQDPTGIITGIETKTAQIKCIVKDAWRNKTVEEADIAWETKVTSIQEELSNSNERARPQPSPNDLPMLGAKALYDTMVIAGLRRQPNWIARFRCKGTDLKTGAYGYSDYVKLEVLAGDTLEQIPKLRLVSHTDPNSPYPNKVECIDDNEKYESQVTWTRQDEPIDPAQITTTPNKAVLKWTHNGIDKFDPRMDAGIYTCRSINSYSSSVKQVYIPYDLIATDYETPITPEVRILSNVNEIFQDSGDRYVRVIQGQPFELICTFYGHPPPEGGLQWSIDRFNGTRNSLSSHWLSMQGLIIHSGRHYWTTIGSPQFDALGRHTGVFQCTALNSIGQIIERDQVRVELHKVYVRINELSESGLIENQKGSNGTITCNAYDGYLQFILPDATYTWEVERINGERVHPNLIADQIELNNNQLYYHGLSPTANKLRIRCIASNDTARYISPDFSFRVFGGDKAEPVKTSDIEPGGTRWISGDGEERITLKIGGKNDLTNHVTIKDGENVQLNCTAYDTVTGKEMTDGNLHFGWRLLGIYGETVPEAGLTRQSIQSYTINNGNTGVLTIEDTRPSPNLPQPSARIQCLATSYIDGVTYYSTLVDLIVYPEEIPVDHVKDVKDREKLNRLSVSVVGLDDRGRLSGTEGSSVKLECIATDRSTKQHTKESVIYGWEFSRLDGTPVDTTSLIGIGDSRLEVNENQLILQGLKQTTSILGRCRVIVPSEDSLDEDTQLSRSEEVFYSPHFRFDIIDSDGTGRRDFIAPMQPIATTKDSDIFIKVDGLDENGALSADKGESVELNCIAMNQTTNEPITEETLTDIEINYGLEVIRLNGLPASTLELAKNIDIDPETGKIKLNELRSHLNGKDVRNRIQARCIAEINYKSDKYPDQGLQRYGSPYFLVNIPKDVEALPDYIDVTHSRYEVTVGGLNNQGVLKVQPGQNIQLKCIIRDKETDTLMDTLTQNQFIGWQFPALPSGHQVNMGDFATRSKVQNDELHLENIRNDYPENLQGRCWFDDGFMHFYSPFFPIVPPSSVTDGRVRVEVQEIGTRDQKEYLCTAYDSRTGKRLSNVTYDWKFTTPNDETIPTVYYFNSIESYKNRLKLGLLNTHIQLAEHLKSIQRIEGRCIVLAKQYIDDTTIPMDNMNDKEKQIKINIYESRPFVIINPLAIDPNDLLTSPDSFPKSHRLYATVDGVKNGAVVSPVGSTVTLTCQVYDSINQIPVENLNYNWEIKRRDGTPIDTAVLARDYINVKGPGGNTLIIGNLRLLSAGLIGRCIVTNDSLTDPTISDIGLLGPNEKIYSPSFDFIITDETSSGSSDDVSYEGNKDYEIDGKDYEVVIEGLDEDGRLKVSKNDNKTLTVFLKHKETGEQIYPSPPNTCAGVETRYLNGYPVPLSYLADTYEFQSDNGKFHLYHMKEPNISPLVQMRFIIEQKKFDEDGKPKDVIRYASQYIDLLPRKDDLPEQVPMEKIYPIIDGLNNCGRLPLAIGNNLTLICRPNDTRLLSEPLLYDWEIRDMYGHVLPRVNLVAPNRGNLPFKIRCTAVVSKRPSIPDEKPSSPKLYTSDYFGMDVRRSDGTSTRTGEEVDIKGSLIKVKIDGLKPDGTFTTQLGENASIMCTAVDSNTDETVQDVIIGWDIRRSNGAIINLGILADQVMQESNKLQFYSMKSLNSFGDDIHGRCIIYRGNQIYRSDYFKIKVSTLPKEVDVEGDGRILVRLVDISPTDRKILLKSGESETIRCIGIDARTGDRVDDLNYGWDYYYTQYEISSSSSSSITSPIRGSLGPLVSKLEESPDGYLSILLNDDLTQKDGAYLRCRLSNGTSIYTSPYYRLVTETDEEVSEVIPVITPRYLITVHGLDKDGQLQIKQGDNVSLECSAIDMTTRKPAENVIYIWDFQEPGVYHPKADFQFIQNQLTITKLDSLSGTVKGRCKVSYKGSNKWDSSPDFLIHLEKDIIEPERKPPTLDDVEKLKEYEESIKQKGIKEADDTDDRILVTVNGLNDDGNLIGAVNDEKTLSCNAEVKEGVNSAILSYNWELMDSNGNFISLSHLADDVSLSSSDGVLRLNGLRVSKLSEQGNLKGHCFVIANITKTIIMLDGIEKEKTEQLLYDSKMFGIAITEDGTYTGPIGGSDLNSNKVRVGVVGLTTSGQLTAESGDKVNLQCYAIDAQTNVPLSDAIYAWEIRDRNDQSIMTETIAQIVLRSINVISFIHLRPTDHLQWSKHLFGRCSAYSPENKHIYYSDYFHINVRQPSIDGKTGPDNHIHVEVTGIPSNGVLSAEEGDNVNLECRAVNITDNTPITSTEAIYHFQFDEAAPDRDDTYGGYLADEIIQEQLSNEIGGIQLTLNGMKYGKWHRGRCVVTLIQKDYDKELKEPIKRYTSKYFWSDIRHKGEVQLEGFDPKKQITTIQGITYDPNVLVKVYGTNPNDTITVKPGENIELDCYALESSTGEPIKGMNYAWELRTYDNQPIHTNRLANQLLIGTNLSDNGQKLQLKGYRSSGEGIRLRCLAKGTDQVENKIRQDQTYASPVYTFETIKHFEDIDKKPDIERKRYEPSQLHPEVVGLNADGTMTAKEGEDVKLQCQVVDSSNGIPIKDEQFNIGWTIATGPDGQPIPFNNLANTILINNDEFNLNELKSTTLKSGGLRGYCSLYLNEDQLISPEKYENHTVILNSDVFVIHVNAKQPDTHIIDSNIEDEKTPYRQWIPGKDPKDAVIVKVYELRPDGSVIVPPGGNLKLNCLALDAVRLRRLTSTDQIPPLFTWELRSSIGGQLIPYTEQASGSIIIKQPLKDPKTAEEVGVSTMELQTIRLPVDAPNGVWSRCVVQIGQQVFTSPYFHIQLQKEATIETYSPLPKSYWSDDKNIELIVKGLDADGNKIVQEGSNIELTCEARNTKTQEILKEDQILIGWQFIDPEKHTYLIPWSNNAQMSGNNLTLKEIEIPGEQDYRWNVWGYCVGDIQDDNRIKHYQSEPFNIGVISEEISDMTTGTPLIRKDGVYVQVQGISDDGLFTATEGSDGELMCHAIDHNTGQPYINSKVTYGWDWRQIDGELADISEIGDIITTEGNKMKITNIKYNTPKKGRCLITIWPKEDNFTEQSPQTYSSDLFFTNIQPLNTVPSLQPEEILPVDVSDDKVIIDIIPMDNDKQQISLTINDDKTDEIRAIAKLPTTDSPLDDTTNPQLIRYSYDLAYISGLPAHTGELGESILFNSKNGSLIIMNPHYTTKPLKIRFNVIVKSIDELNNNANEQEPNELDNKQKESNYPLKRYRTDYYPIVIISANESEIPIWSKHPVPVYDISGRSIKVQIDGLDDNGNAAGIPGEDLKLTCLVLDNFDLEVDLKSSSYTWQFIDLYNNPINPNRIGQHVEIQNGRILYIKHLHQSIIQDHIRGRCIIIMSVPIPVDIELRDDLPPIQEYGSSYFKFTKKITTDQSIQEGEESAVTIVTESIEETTTSVKEEEEEQVTESIQDRNFHLKIDSSTNTIYPMDKSKYTILARVQRALDLSCQAVFTDNPPETNDQFPKLIWYYRQPEIPGDVPIPSQLLPISPPRMETLSILPQTDYKIAISSDTYTFRDDNAEFQCQAFMNDDEPVDKITIFIQKIREMFNVRVFDEESRSKLYVFTGTSKTLTCYVDDLITGERVEPSNYQWEMNLGNENGIWIRDTDPRQGAEDISGWRSNQLQLNKLRLPSTTISDESVYEVRCIASYNATYNTSSHPFIINVRNKPMIKSIRIDRVKPDESILEPVDMPKDSYDSTQDYELGCKPEVTSGEAVATWFKCQNDDCSSLKEIVLTGDRLFYFANSTRYIDEGRFRCQVSLQLKEYNFKLIEYQDVIIKRQAAPAIYSSGSITYTTNDEMSLQCTDESSSPESKVEWTFEPSGKPPPERRLPKLIGNTYAYGRIYIFAIARGQLIPEHSGKYTCIATNPYGTANSSITVTVTEDLSRGKLRFVRRIIRRAFAG
ncbi:unnamed protein product [Schistosoma guineensis]|nr:unnamed protein product [Schistosoma guineensis]